MYKKYEAYGLNKDFVYFRPGSDAALSAAFTAAYEKKEPIVGYYWEPTWLLGKYDFVLLEDEPYDAEKYFEGKTACPSVKVTIGASNKFKEKAPETGDNYNATAKWLLKNNDNLIDQWLDADKAAAVRKALN